MDPNRERAPIFVNVGPPTMDVLLPPTSSPDSPPPSGTIQPSSVDQPFFAPLSSPPLLPNATLYSTSTTPLFGPTPISQQQGMLLPYYDPRSPYSIEQADARTKWRFLGALFWAIIILSALALVIYVMLERHFKDGLGQVSR